MITKYEMKIEQLETELEKPAFKALIDEGWEITMTLPVIDNNDPTLILFLQKKEKDNTSAILGQLVQLNDRDRYFSITIIVLFLLQFIFVIYQNTI